MTPSPPFSRLIPFSLSVLRPSSFCVIIPLRHFVKLPFQLKCVELSYKINNLWNIPKTLQWN